MSVFSPPSATSTSALSRVFLIASILGAQIATFFLLIGSLLDSETPWSSGFRDYFANDQLSYLAIAVNTSQGLSPWVEPLTETGVSYYPSLWYSIIGAISGLTGVSTWTMWTIAGIAAACTSIGVIGGIAYRMSGKVWAPILPAVMLFTGTFSTWTNDSWYSSLNSHAVIWGPYGTLFTLNAETLGVLLNATSISLMLLFTRKYSPLVGIVIALLLGITANIQTYSFFTATVFAALLMSVLAVMNGKSTRTLVLTSGGLFVAVLLLGNVISSAAGPLPLLVVLLATLIPVNAPLIRAHAKQSMLFGGIFVLAASPQIIHTILGLLSKDEFLLYRQESSLELGIDPLSALISVIPLGGISLFAFLVARTARNTTFMAFYIAAAIGIVVMSTNDLWGFNQEPYRLWLQFTIVIAVAGSIPLAWSLAQQRSRTMLAVLVVSVALWVLSLVDFVGFYRYTADQGVLDFTDSRAQTLAELTPAENGLFLPSRCEDPAVFKAITGAATADYNLGLAWPERRDAIDRILYSSGTVTISELRDAGVEYVVQDSACTDEWVIDSPEIDVVSGGGYANGVLTVTRIPSA